MARFRNSSMVKFDQVEFSVGKDRPVVDLPLTVRLSSGVKATKWLPDQRRAGYGSQL